MRSMCRCISSIATANTGMLSGRSFKKFIQGKLEGFEGEAPMMSDWADHLTTIFPEVRLQEVHRDARRRWRAVGAHMRAARFLGRVDLRSGSRSMRLGIW